MTPNPYHRRPTGLPRVHGPSCPSSAASCHCAPPPRRLSRVPPYCGPARPRPLWIRPKVPNGPFRFKDTAGGAGTHSRHTGTRITRITQTNLTTIQTHQPTAVHTATNPRPSGRGPHTVAGSRHKGGHWHSPGTGSLLKPPDSEFSESFRLRTPYSTVQDIASLCCTGTRHRQLQAYAHRFKDAGGSRVCQEPGHTQDSSLSQRDTPRAMLSAGAQVQGERGHRAPQPSLSDAYQTVLSLDPA